MTAGSPNYLDALCRIVERAELEGKSISYDSSWAINTSLRREPGFPRLLKEILTATIVHVHRDYRIHESICVGVPRLKTENYFRTLDSPG
jgi:hypothetical protein